ncbi:MAG TPA: hypothetical protein PLO61_08105 [Fimbriimonadaceae bacterium]|nr:hypothetical protein [Fimbriimonadaceae bacterium]HRJ33432.1 hypothetical protein [Fimbriimonadaceae bacterium]
MIRLERITGLLTAMIPVSLVALVGFSGRLGPQTPPPLYSTPRGEARIDAYREVTRAAQALKLGEGGTPQLKELISVADVWIQGRREQSLVDLTPVFAYDSSDLGAKRQIFRVRNLMADRLLVCGMERAARGQSAEAIQSFVTLLELCEVAKFSDLNSLHASSVRQDRALLALLKLWDEMGPRDQDRLRTLLAQIQPSLDRVQGLLNEQIRLTEQTLARVNLPLKPAERKELSRLKEHVVSAQVSSRDLVKEAHRLGSTRAPIAATLSQARIAVHAERIRFQSTRALLDRLDPQQTLARRDFEPRVVAAR